MILAIAAASLLSGCGPDYRYFRVNGQIALIDHEYAHARDLFEQAHDKRPSDPENLFDLGTVHMVYARQRVADENIPAALRELDSAIHYFARAIEAHPGMQAAIEAKNEALEMKGRYDEALSQAEWASAFVGPRAEVQIFLAKELEERGDYDGALLRFRQAVAMERSNPTAHAELGRFLLRRDNRRMAVTHLSRAYQLNPLEPGVADALTDLGEPLPRTVRTSDP